MKFTSTKAHADIRTFIFEINHSIINSQQLPTPPGFILEKIKEIVDSTPLSSVKGRYANPAMASVIIQIEILTENNHLRNAFGNKVRMDFGTGHELNFLCFLFSLVDSGLEITRVSSILSDYFHIIRHFISKFNVEAAGSRGCWALDDYLLLPYLFGSAQQLAHPPTGSIFEEACIGNNSPVLKGIRQLPWEKINTGMLKMYQDDVLGREVVTQHFIYTSYLPM